MLLLIAGGAAGSVPLIFPALGALSWVAMVPAFAVLATLAREPGVRLRRMYGNAFIFFLTFYSMGFHWFIAMYPLDFVGGMSKAEALMVVIVATLGLGALQASFSALFGVLLAMGSRRGPINKRPYLLPAFAAILYPLFEWAQTFTWAGVPWSRLASGQVESAAVLKSVSLLGPYFLSAVIVAVNFLLTEALLSDKIRLKKMCTVGAALTVGVNAALGALLIAVDTDNGREITVAAVQPNVSSRDPWGFDTEEEMKVILEEYSLDAALNGADLIVWPETVYTRVFYDEEYSDSDFYDFSVAMAKECGATIVVGAFSNDGGNDKNSLFFISSDGEVNETVYSKRKLVPFGEFVPWRGFFEAVMPQLVDLLILSGDLEQSSDPAVADTEAGKLGGIICFDSIYETLSLDSVRDGAELLVLSTNDSWFIGSAAVRMHASQARLRAVETGRYLVRSASTGISMIISPSGEILDLEPELVGGYAIHTVKLRDSKTLYSIVGNLFIYLSIAAVGAVLVSGFVIDRGEKDSTCEKNKGKI